MRAEGAMIRQNLHAHCTYDDGRNTPEEMVRASQCAGLESVGISLHSMTSLPCKEIETKPEKRS